MPNPDLLETLLTYDVDAAHGDSWDYTFQFETKVSVTWQNIHYAGVVDLVYHDPDDFFGLQLQGTSRYGIDNGQKFLLVTDFLPQIALGVAGQGAVYNDHFRLCPDYVTAQTTLGATGTDILAPEARAPIDGPRRPSVAGERTAPALVGVGLVAGGTGGISTAFAGTYTETNRASTTATSTRAFQGILYGGLPVYYVPSPGTGFYNLYEVAGSTTLTTETVTADWLVQGTAAVSVGVRRRFYSYGRSVGGYYWAVQSVSIAGSAPYSAANTLTDVSGAAVPAYTAVSPVVLVTANTNYPGPPPYTALPAGGHVKLTAALSSGLGGMDTVQALTTVSAGTQFDVSGSSVALTQTAAADSASAPRPGDGAVIRAVPTLQFAPLAPFRLSLHERWFDGADVVNPNANRLAVPPQINADAAKLGSYIPSASPGGWGRAGWFTFSGNLTDYKYFAASPRALVFGAGPPWPAEDRAHIDASPVPPGTVLGTLAAARTAPTLSASALSVTSASGDTAGQHTDLTVTAVNCALQRWLTGSVTLTGGATARLTLTEQGGGANTYTLRPDGGGNFTIDLALPDADSMPGWGTGPGLTQFTPSYTDSPAYAGGDYGQALLYGYARVAGDAAAQAAARSVVRLTLAVGGPSQSASVTGLAFGADVSGPEAWAQPLEARNSHASQISEGGGSVAAFTPLPYYQGRLQLLVDGKRGLSYPFAAAVTPSPAAGSGWAATGTFTVPPSVKELADDVNAMGSGLSLTFTQSFTPPPGYGAGSVLLPPLTADLIPAGMVEDPHFPYGAHAARPWTANAQSFDVGRHWDDLSVCLYDAVTYDGYIVHGAGFEGLAVSGGALWTGALTFTRSVAGYSLPATVAETAQAGTGFFRTIVYQAETQPWGTFLPGDAPGVSRGSGTASPNPLPALGELGERAYTYVLLRLSDTAHPLTIATHADRTGRFTLVRQARDTSGNPTGLIASSSPFGVPIVYDVTDAPVTTSPADTTPSVTQGPDGKLTALFRRG